MAKHVFVFGAGASASAGAPMMAGFLDTAERLHANRLAPIDHDAFALVFRGITALKRAHSNAQLDVDNIESVMGAFEAAALFGHLDGWERADVERLPQAIRTLITETIEQTFKFPQPSRGNILPTKDYREFVKVIQKVPREDRVALLTFNYDLGLDYAVQHAGADIDYCLTEAPRQSTGYRILKLHGSLNWRRVPAADDGTSQIVFAPIGQLLSDYSRNWSLHAAGESVAISFESLIRRLDHPMAKGQTVIVPPTWSKSTEYKAISPVWRAAAEELRDAEHVYVIGFSLPATDTFFQMLFALGTIGSARLKRFLVFDPDAAALEAKFKAILGPVALRRFDAYEGKFDLATRQWIPKVLEEADR